MQPIVANVVLLEGLPCLGTVTDGLKSTISKATVFDNSSQSVYQKPEARVCVCVCVRACVRACVRLWVRVRACACVSVSVSSRAVCLMMFVSASQCSPHCCALVGMRGDSVHFSTVRYLHCHCLLVLLVSKRCRSAVCFAASAVPS